MPYSFYLHPRLKNIIDLMVQNEQNTIGVDYYVDQIRSESSKIQEIDPTLGDQYRSPIKTLTDFIVAFYQNIYSNKTGLLSESLGSNFDYKINFEIVHPKAATTQFDDEGSVPQPVKEVQQESKVNLKYWYEVGPVDQNGKILSVIFKTQPKEITISTDKDGIIIADSVEKLNNLVDNFPSATLPTYLDNNDFNDLWTNINRLVGDKEDYVDITEVIKKFPMYSYFSLHYPELGLAVKKDAVKKPVEVMPTEPVATQAAQTPNSTGELAGIYENYPGIDTIKVLHFYVYNKKNPNEFSTKKLKFFVYKTDKSLLNS
ncbi:hypothetical protein [Mesomycoplasma ovipneumoniae]|uniref:hypothetical protein n=1 Tax=Mesomycoplasma ovipneumoniae TaxID=29562 RepID=UPI00311C9E9B